MKLWPILMIALALPAGVAMGANEAPSGRTGADARRAEPAPSPARTAAQRAHRTLERLERANFSVRAIAPNDTVIFEAGGLCIPQPKPHQPPPPRVETLAAMTRNYTRAEQAGEAPPIVSVVGKCWVAPSG